MLKKLAVLHVLYALETAASFKRVQVAVGPSATGKLKTKPIKPTF